MLDIQTQGILKPHMAGQFVMIQLFSFFLLLQQSTWSCFVTGSRRAGILYAIIPYTHTACYSLSHVWSDLACQLGTSTYRNILCWVHVWHHRPKTACKC
jgi:hypothetical protein